MFKLIHYFFLVSLAFFLTGCATAADYNQLVRCMQGRHIAKLINVWGYPDLVVHLPQGCTEYRYVRKQIYTLWPPPACGSTYVNNGKRPMSACRFTGGICCGVYTFRYCNTWFTINPQGIVVDGQFEGNNCVALSPYSLTP